MRGAASNGPAIAPTESMALSTTPKARPSWSLATEPARRLSRAGALPPRAVHDTARARATTGHTVANPKAPWPAAVTA